MSDGTNLGKAYVQIIPSADGIKAQLASILGDNMPSGTSAGKSIGKGLTSGFGSAVKGLGSIMSKTLAGVAKVGLASVGVATAGVVAVVKSSAEAFADYQQNLGGVETLFKENSDAVVKYANDAYKTAGVSANAYMENVTSFSASLLQGLGGDTAQAAEVANTAMVDMSDNANKFGTDISSIQNAYQGFAKNNYTMLDNLKLGYGGTQAEMARLINDSGVLGDTVEVTASTVNDVSFDKMIEAIHTVQDEMGITGTTSLEAGTTVSGSMGMVSAAWENLMAGMADKDADLGGLIDNLVDSLSGAGENLLPVVEQALNGVVTLISTLAPEIVEKIPELINTVLPNLIIAATSIVSSLATALPQILTSLITAIKGQLPTIISAIKDIMPLLKEGVSQLITAVVELLPTLIPMLVEGACQLFVGILDALNQISEELMPMLPELINSVVEILIENMPTLIDGAFTLFAGICDGLAQSAPEILQGIVDLCAMLVVELIEHIPDLIDAGGQLLAGLASGLCDVFSPISDALSDIMINISDWFSQKWQDAKTWGSDLINNFIQGIKDKWESLKQTVSDVAGSIADFLGFSEPDKGPLSNFHTYAPDMMDLFAQGIKDNEDVITTQFNSSLKPIANTSYDAINSVQGSHESNPKTNNSVTLFLADTAGKILASTVANPLDIINGTTVNLFNRGVAL